MRLGKLREILQNIPDEAEVSYKLYLNTSQVALVITLASDLYQVYLDPYRGLPKVEEVTNDKVERNRAAKEYPSDGQ